MTNVEPNQVIEYVDTIYNFFQTPAGLIILFILIPLVMGELIIKTIVHQAMVFVEWSPKKEKAFADLMGIAGTTITSFIIPFLWFDNNRILWGLGLAVAAGIANYIWSDYLKKKIEKKYGAKK